MSCKYYRGSCLFLNGKVYEDNCKGCPIKKAYNKGVRDTKKDYERPTVDPFEPDYVNAEGVNARQISDILVKAYNSGLLAICGGMFNEKDVDECYIALMIAFKLLKTNIRNIEAE